MRATFPNKPFTVVIVGGGVIGLSIARALALCGVRDIALIERAKLGAEASSAAAGMLAPQIEADSIDDFFNLACRSRDLYLNFARSLHEETGIDIELDTTGTLYLALNEHDLRELDDRLAWQTQAGLLVEKLTAAETHKLEPCLTPGVLGALRFPLDIQVENRRLVSALANSVEKLGVDLILETTVESLVIERGRIRGVETSHGLVTCETVVMAAGTWTNFISLTGERQGKVTQVPTIEPVRGQMVCFDARPQLVRHVIHSSRGYLVPRRDGRLLAGSTSESVGFAKQTTAGGIAEILNKAMEITPATAALPIAESWAGLRPRAPDGLPVLGPCDEIGGLFFATGHYRNGILLAPVTGELVAQAIVEGTLPPSLGPFTPDRFELMTVS
ncbi:MAG TPA: glycine oxidase ThiO [Pyrinomonadaceae bacterium]|nr:glycine oxidase ThiO [Pyrinomonadaceae bacterium]